jgi:hypothetical protein
MKKLSKKLRILFGLRYAVNKKTREVHDLKNIHKNCHIELWNIGDFWFVTKKQIKDYNIWMMHNGCRWCMRKYDRG